MEIRAYAKINLALDVLGKRDDGYHEVDTIMQEIDLSDIIEIEEGRLGFGLTCDNLGLELDENNLVYKAWNLMKKYYYGDPSVVIRIEKNIPIAAGLAGGSSDCAATIKGLNRLWNLRLEDEKLMEIGASLGADVSFFFKGGTCRARGIGEKIDRIGDFSKRHLLLVNNESQISSKFIYDNMTEYESRLNIEGLVKAIENDNDNQVYSMMGNKMEEVILKFHPGLKEIKDDLYKNGSRVSLISGSGPTVYGLFDTKDQAIKAEEELSKKYKKVYRTVTR